MKQRSLFLIRFYLLTLIIFLVAKVAFMIANLTDHSFTAIDAANVIWHGLSLDLSTSIYFLLLPFIITMISLWWDGDLLRRILRVYYGVIAIMLALAFVACIPSGDSSSMRVVCSIWRRPSRPEPACRVSIW